MITISSSFVTIDGLDKPTFAAVADTKSMLPTFGVKDQIILDTPKDLKVGDICVFNRGDFSRACHRLQEIKGDWYRFKGDHNWWSDKWVLRAAIEFKVIGCIYG